MSSVKLLKPLLVPIKPVLLAMETCFVDNVTMADMLQYNCMFVQLFVLCKLNEPNHIGFSKCLLYQEIYLPA